ncbi:hypothetical protein [Fischerella sp. JS2]|uniref:hypothetical protein n=1 Tax=Fischerella sp. JS2 TaxID=2597771 RepID=UPI0028EBA61B|nr:hypothetical protein [Fischerella sp. JS2]
MRIAKTAKVDLCICILFLSNNYLMAQESEFIRAVNPKSVLKSFEVPSGTAL